MQACENIKEQRNNGRIGPRQKYKAYDLPSVSRAGHRGISGNGYERDQLQRSDSSARSTG